MNNESNEVRKLYSDLNQSLIGRETEVKLMLAALVAEKHMLMIGPPGTAKSMLVNLLAQSLGGKYYRTLLTKFTVPDELFGPLNLQALKQGKYERICAGYLPDAEFAFLDEIFKAGPAVLNSLLGILADRELTVGEKIIKCPLKLCVAASNEYPESDDTETLSALFDRLLIRTEVRPISQEPGLLERLSFDNLSKPNATISGKTLSYLREQREDIKWTNEAKKCYCEIVEELISEGISPSDRRIRQSTDVVRAVGVLRRTFLGNNTENKVAIQDCSILRYTLWTTPDTRMKCRDIVLRLANPKKLEFESLMDEILETTELSLSEESRENKMERVSKLQDIMDRAQNSEGMNPKDREKICKYVRRELGKLSEEILTGAAS